MQLHLYFWLKSALCFWQNHLAVWLCHHFKCDDENMSTEVSITGERKKNSFKKLKIDGNERQLRLRVCCTLLTHSLRLCVGGRQFSCALLFFFSFCKMLNISKKRVHATDVQMCWPLTLKNSSWAAYWAKLTKWQWHRQLLRQIETE